MKHGCGPALVCLPEPNDLARSELWAIAFDAPAIEQQFTAFAAGTRGQKPVSGPRRNRRRADTEKIRHFAQREDLRHSHAADLSRRE